MELDPELIKTGTLSAIATYGLTDAAKPVIKKWIDLAWEKTAVRLAALMAGAAWGYLLTPRADGLMAGVCGAALSAVIVAAIKSKIKAR